MAFGDNIQKLRNSKNMSQQELADAIGIGRSTLANYEQNKREPNFNTLESIAKYFNVSTDYILGFTNDQFDHTHKDSLNEIVYKQLLKLTDEKNHIHFTKNHFAFLNLIKDGTLEMNEKGIDLISSLFCVNASYLLGLTSNYYFFDPMESEDILDKEKINKLLQNPDEITKEAYKLKCENYEKSVTNKAFNLLIDLGIEKIDGKYIKTIDSRTLSNYYSSIIKYLKNSIKMVDLDKVIKEYNVDNSNKFLNNNSKNISSNTYYYDFYSTSKINSIEDVKNGYQFENYLAYLLSLNDYIVYTNTEQNMFEEADILALKEKNIYIIKCKYIAPSNYSYNSNFLQQRENYEYKNIISSIKKYTEKISNTSIETKFTNNNFEYIYAFNTDASFLETHISELTEKIINTNIIIWDREKIKKFELNLK